MQRNNTKNKHQRQHQYHHGVHLQTGTLIRIQLEHGVAGAAGAGRPRAVGSLVGQALLLVGGSAATDRGARAARWRGRRAARTAQDAGGGRGRGACGRTLFAGGGGGGRAGGGLWEEDGLALSWRGANWREVRGKER